MYIGGVSRAEARSLAGPSLCCFFTQQGHMNHEYVLRFCRTCYTRSREGLCSILTMRLGGLPGCQQKLELVVLEGGVMEEETELVELRNL